MQTQTLERIKRQIFETLAASHVSMNNVFLCALSNSIGYTRSDAVATVHERVYFNIKAGNAASLPHAKP
jgi:hypothetical protein